MTSLAVSSGINLSASYTLAPRAVLPHNPLAPPPAASASSTATTTEDRLLTSGIGLVGASVLGGVTGQAVRTALASAPAAAASRFSTGMSAVASGALTSIGVGTAISAGLNVLGSGVLLAMGRITKGQAAGAVVANSVTALVGSTSAVLLGGAATAALGAIGVAGLPLTLAGIGFGIVASGAASAIFRRTGAARGIYDGVSGAIDN